MRILQLRTGTYCQRCRDRTDIGPELLHELLRQSGTDKLGQEFLIRDVRVDYILKPVLQDEAVEIVCRHHHSPGNGYPHPRILGGNTVPLQHIVHECKSPGLAAERAFTHSCEMYVAGIAVLVERGDNPLPCEYAVILDLSDNKLPGIPWIGEVGKAGLAQSAS